MKRSARGLTTNRIRKTLFAISNFRLSTYFPVRLKIYLCQKDCIMLLAKNIIKIVLYEVIMRQEHVTIQDPEVSRLYDQIKKPLQGLKLDIIHEEEIEYEIGYAKWKAHQYDNKTMISVTNNYLPKYQKLISESTALQPPKQYQNATDLYTKSLESELQSNNHFRNYLLTNNSTESKLSSKLLSDAFKYEIEAFKKLTSSGLFTIAP